MIPENMKYYFCTCLTLIGKKDDHKNFRGECDDNLFPFFFLLVYFFPSIPFILIPVFVRACWPKIDRGYLVEAV